MPVSTTHLVLLPAYNAGPLLPGVVREVLRRWQPVLVVDDGSTDGTAGLLRDLASTEPALSVVSLPRNSGKGAAVLAGARAAFDRGFTHVLVMDADGQHPADSIAEFMETSRRQPGSLVLGRPIFPDNMPAERRHGRKLSVGLVRFELFGAGVADPLFGFRVYPLTRLLAALEGRRGGRGYDFDTEAAVRLCWAGVRPLNLAAPVRYLSRAEGGVSHFRYGRDNLRLAWMHTRLITELLLLRWPILLRHRRSWGLAGVALVLMFCGVAAGRAADADPLVNPEHRLVRADPAWTGLASAMAHQPDTVADFTELRHFSFRREPVELKGEVRVSTAHGLSLHYTAPQERVVVFDARGVLVRTGSVQSEPPVEPQAGGFSSALLPILRLDFAALEKDFELYGQHDGDAWTLVLVPRGTAARRSVERITVAGLGTAVRRIELRHSAKQSIEIAIAPPRPPAPFTAGELKQFFR